MAGQNRDRPGNIGRAKECRLGQLGELEEQVAVPGQLQSKGAD